MSQPQSKPPSQEEAEALRARVMDQVKGVLSPEQLERLSTLFRERDWILFLTYLQPLQKMLEAQVWEARSWDHYRFMQGQWDTLRRVLGAPLEVERYLEELRKEEKENGKV